MPYTDIIDLKDFRKSLKNNAVLAYFSHENCNVCKVLKPKVAELVATEFKKVKLFYVDIYKHPEVAAENGIFIAPTLLLFMEGKESLRLSRNFGIDELRTKINRPYELLYGKSNG